MNPKDIKEKLANAKKCLNKGDFKGAINFCKLILKEDEENYNALVFLGKAYHEDRKDHQCAEVLKKAVKSNPNQISAWQGLVKHYERVDRVGSPSPELITAYKKISEFYEKDNSLEDKYLEHQLKFAGGLIANEDYSGALKVIEKLIAKIPINLDIAKLLLRVFDVKNLKLKSDSTALEEKALQLVIHDKPTDKHIKRYTAILYQAKNPERAIEECLKMQRFFNLFYYPIDLLTRVYFESDLESYSFVDQIEEFVTKLKRLHPTTRFGNFALGKSYFSKKKYANCIDALTAGLEYTFSIKASQMLVQALLKLWDFSKAIDVCQKTMEVEIINKFENKTRKEIIKLLEIEAKIGVYFQNYFEEKNDEKEKEKDQELLLDDIGELIFEYEVDNFNHASDFSIQKAKYYLLKENYVKFEELLNQINSTPTINTTTYPEIELLNILLDGKKDKSSIADLRDSILSLCEIREDNFDIQMYSALYLKYLMDSTNASFDLFSKITMKWSNQPAAYFYSSLFKISENDVESSIYYLEKAFALYKCKTYGLLLTDLFSKIEDFDNYLKVILDCLKYLKSSDTQWANFRLAIYTLKEGQVDEAIFAFQNILKKDYNNGATWENIAEAYTNRGSYLSARKAYTKAIELGRDKAFCLYKIGQIQRNLLEYQEAVETLSQIAEDYLPALMELSLAYLDLSKEYLSKYLDHSLISSVNSGLKTSFRSIQKQEDDVQGWIMMGEFTLLIKDLPEETIFEVPSIFLSENVQSYSTNCDSVEIGLIQLLSIGTLCFEKAVKLIQEGSNHSILLQSYTLYSISRTYYIRSLFSNDEDNKATLLDKAMTYARFSIIADDNSYIHWNHLGVIAQAQNNFALAKHAFITSIDINPNNAITLSNLGILYFLQKKYSTAYKCISRAQSINPRYATSWIGQAYIAEYLNSTEATDLFRHSSQMENTNDLATIRFIERLVTYISDSANKTWQYSYYVDVEDGYTAGLDLITRYIRRHPKDIEAINYQGILAGLKGLKRTSENCFRKCREICEADADDKIKNFVSETILLNLAISLEEKEEFHEALEVISKVKYRNFKLCATEALIHKKLGNYQESYKVYEEMLCKPILPDDYKQQIYTMIGMSLVLYKLYGFDQAKDKLLECYQIDTDVIEPLLVLCSLSLSNNHIEVVNHTLDELTNFEDQPEHMSDIAFLRACGFCIQNEIEKSRYPFYRILLMYPRNGQIWGDLANHIVRFTEDNQADARYVRVCIENSINLRKKNASEDMSLIALSALMARNWSEAILLSQKVVRLFPFVPKNWAILASAIYNKSKTTNDLEGLEKALKIAENTLAKFDLTDDKTELFDWLTDFKEQVTSLLSSKCI